MAYRIRYKTRIQWTRWANAAVASVITAGGFLFTASCLELCTALWRDEGWYLALARLAGNMIHGAS